ncbi:hypothetical protein FBU30_007661 [Linnemannia zychae]|nr:hypothetical protein FBU30_007661 [Linnemannia zychae]
MGEFFDEISENHADWIKKQKMIFVGTAPMSSIGKVNVSPKGYDCFRIIGPNQVCYLELTGSGIETQSHVEENKRITIMMCAFEGAPRVLRLFGTGRVHRVGTPEFDMLFAKHFSSSNDDNKDNEKGDIRNCTAKRAIILVDVYKVGTSCGYGVPYYEFKGSRPTLTNYWGKKSEGQVADYWVLKNTTSLDGLPGMRHEKMGSKWAPSVTKEKKIVVVGKEDEGWESWWGTLRTNVTLVAAGAGLGAAVTSYVMKKRR